MTASTFLDVQTAFTVACTEIGLDPANTNHFVLECRRQGVDPGQTSMSDLDRNASDLWATVRRLKRA